MSEKTKLLLQRQKDEFQDAMFKIIKRRYDIQLEPETAYEFIEILKNLPPKEKKFFWDEISKKLNEDRTKVYKFYNNTYKASIMPKFPEEILAVFKTEAYQVSIQLLKANPDLSLDLLLEQAMEQTKARVNFKQYDEQYHPDCGYHKIRNTIINTFEYWNNEAPDVLLSEQRSGDKESTNIEKDISVPQKIEEFHFPIFDVQYDEDEDARKQTDAATLAGIEISRNCPQKQRIDISSDFVLDHVFSVE